MKNSTLYLIIGTATLFASCSRQLTIEKQHYSNGYYIALSGKSPKTTSEHKNLEKSQQIAISKPVTDVNSTTLTKTNTENVTPDVAVAKICKKEKANKKEVANVLKQQFSKPSVSNTIEKPTAIEKTAPTLSVNKSADITEVTSAKDRDTSGVAFILIVIITIFIPPLGVALMYGLDLHFWIDLILTLLFFIPGLIYGLIVVLM